MLIKEDMIQPNTFDHDVKINENFELPSRNSEHTSLTTLGVRNCPELCKAHNLVILKTRVKLDSSLALSLSSEFAFKRSNIIGKVFVKDVYVSDVKNFLFSFLRLCELHLRLCSLLYWNKRI